MQTAPVLLLVFNRPETTTRVLQAVRAAAPRRLFVAADGPRPGIGRDAARCAEVLRLVREGVDWSCDVEYLTREKNLGCRMAVSSAVSWFFEMVEEGIILEDDCLPVPAFFPFCTSLLERYRGEPRVVHIGGFNCQRGRRRGSASYYFSRYFHIWGWASWRRAWDGYDVGMSDYSRFLDEGALENLFERPALKEFWKDIFDATARGSVDTWDYQWVYRNFKDDRLAIVPNYNLVENIGYGADATHTSAGRGRAVPAETGVSEDLVHPRFILPCRAADDYTYRKELRIGRFHDFKRLVKRVLR